MFIIYHLFNHFDNIYSRGYYEINYNTDMFENINDLL